MELRNEFTVTVPVEQAWTVLTDVERVAPCIPGAELQEVEGDEYRGVVRLKVGPITAQYRGHARFLKQDAATRQAVMRAEGRETRGQGNATATIVATLLPEGDGTRVTIETDLTVTGRVAQFGRGVLAEVSNKLVGQFVESLESTVLAAPTSAPSATSAGAPAPAHASAPTPGSVAAEAGDGGSEVSGSPRAEPATADPAQVLGVTAEAAGTPGEARDAKPQTSRELNVLALIGPALLKRALPVGAVVAVLVLVWRRRATR